MRDSQLEKICTRVGITIEDLRSYKRSGDIPMKKKIVYYILRYKHLLTLAEIGTITNKDHSTIRLQLATLMQVVRNLHTLTAEVDFDGNLD